MYEVTWGHMEEESVGGEKKRERKKKGDWRREIEKVQEGESQMEKVVLKWTHQAAPSHREREERSPPSF